MTSRPTWNKTRLSLGRDGSNPFLARFFRARSLGDLALYYFYHIWDVLSIFLDWFGDVYNEHIATFLLRDIILRCFLWS